MQLRLDAQLAMTPGPGEGYNVVGVDTFEDPGDELFLISNHATREEAETAAAAYRKKPDAERVYVYAQPEGGEPVQKAQKPSHYIRTKPRSLEW